MNNWKTTKEAKGLCCITSYAGGSTFCIADQCAHWLWRLCLECQGHGNIPVMNDNYSIDMILECFGCDGSGRDKSGLGRCGLIMVSGVA